MRQKLLIIFVFVVAISSCKKNEIDVTLTPHEEQRIVGEGLISQHYDHQRFLFSLSNALGNEKQSFTNDPVLLMKTPEGIIHFISDTDGWYHSEIPFQGVPGEKYSIQFTHKGEIHEAKTTMPYPAGVNAVLLPDTTLATFPYSTGSLTLELTSDTAQYVHFDLFHKHDTWTEIPIPVYQKHLLKQDSAQTVFLTIDNGFPLLHQGDSLLIISKTLSKDVSDYLDDLQLYVTNDVVNSQYHNPPYFYTNGAYGLGYGSHVDSLYHVVGE